MAKIIVLMVFDLLGCGFCLLYAGFTLPALAGCALDRAGDIGA
jgi:hypothetical protein